jgi:hypothetical protein
MEIDEELDEEIVALLENYIGAVEGLIEAGYFDEWGDEGTPRRITKKKDYHDSTWQKFLRDNRRDLEEVPGSKAQQVFRNRWRVPYDLFNDLLQKSVAMGFSKAEKDAAGFASIPLELKLLGVLRVLGRGVTFDEVAEHVGSAFGGSIHYEFFCSWCEKFSETYKDVFVKKPASVAELQESCDVYAKLGFPGCIGSIDVTHIPWHNCPAALANSYTGKGKQPTIAFEVVCDHRRRIISVTDGHCGSRNDKAIIRLDPFANEVRHSGLYRDFQYKLFNRDGVEYDHRGAYMLSDNGYHPWSMLIYPSKHSTDYEEHMFSTRTESVRKDIECVFGILKKRFRVLVCPLRIRSLHTCNAVFWTCCILHNMLLSYDGLDVGSTDDDDDDDDPGQMGRIYRRYMEPVDPANLVLGNEDIGWQTYFYMQETVDTITHYDLMERLIVNYSVQSARGLVNWN